jgi:hypothetical protein
MVTILFTVVILISGYLLGSLILKNISSIGRFGLSIGLGMLIFSIIPFIQLLFGIALSRNSVYLLIVLVLLILGFLNYTRKSISGRSKKLDFPDSSIFLKDEGKYFFMLMIVVGVVLIFITLYFPISAWDALTLYDFRGKVLSQGLLLKDLQSLDSFDRYNEGYYFAYPMSTSLIHALYYLVGSNSPQIIYPLIFFSLVIFFYYLMSHYVSRRLSLSLSLILVTSNVLFQHATMPYTNLPYAYFYFVSTALLVVYILEKKDLGLLIVSALFLAGSSWMRFVEPFYLINILILMFFCFRKQVSVVSMILYSLPVLILRGLWGITLRIYAPDTFLNSIDYSLLLKSLFSLPVDSLKLALSAYIGFVNQNALLFSIFLVSAVLFVLKGNYKDWSPEKIYLLIVFSDFLIILAGTFIIGIVLPGRSEVYDSLGRFGLFLFPLIIFAAGLILNDQFKFKNRSGRAR